ncbi:MAG: ABC transporter permease [Bacteroidaceae bacterium]|nr:ABC transporter permease [Bacteroidaceae bacterium]
MSPLPYLLEKEFKQMMRNIVLPVVFVLLPVAMINVVPRLATQEVKHVRFCAVDNDRSTGSERLVQKLAASAYFDLVATPATHSAAMAEVESGAADLIVEIAPDFERNLVRTGRADISLLANAVDGTKSGLGASYAAQIINDYAASLADPGSAADAASLITTRYLYNVTLDYKTYMIPGLMGMLLVLLVGFLPALNIVGEKERGTIEQMNVTPVGKFTFILSKLIPYWAVGLAVLAFSMALAAGIHGVTPKSGAGAVFVFATVFILVVSSLGLIVSNYSDTTQQASLVMFFFLVIFILLSGLLTPVTSMPRWAQVITYANPLRHFMEAMRGIYIKGATLPDLLPQFLRLTAMAALLWVWAIGSYRKSQ